MSLSFDSEDDFRSRVRAHLQNPPSTLKMTSGQDVETSVTINSPSKASFHQEDQILLRNVTPGFKPFSSFFLYLQ